MTPTVKCVCFGLGHGKCGEVPDQIWVHGGLRHGHGVAFGEAAPRQALVEHVALEDEAQRRRANGGAHNRDLCGNDRHGCWRRAVKS